MYILFGDLLDGITEGFINPTLILAFITFFATGGYLLEKYTSWNSWLVAGTSASIALILDTILNIFVLVPFKNAEHSLVSTNQSLVGRNAKVITKIPSGGFGEIIIESKTGKIAKAAKSIDNNEIQNGTNVVVKDIVRGYVVVSPSENDK